MYKHVTTGKTLIRSSHGFMVCLILSPPRVTGGIGYSVPLLRKMSHFTRELVRALEQVLLVHAIKRHL